MGEGSSVISEEEERKQRWSTNLNDKVPESLKGSERPENLELHNWPKDRELGKYILSVDLGIPAVD